MELVNQGITRALDVFEGIPYKANSFFRVTRLVELPSADKLTDTRLHY
jgi:hypothetical protein